MKIRRHMHPDHIPAVPKNLRGQSSKRRPTREKMGSSYGTFVKRSETSRSDDLVFRPLWGKVYNHNGEEINPIEIQKQIDERTAMTSWVRSGQSTTIELNKRLFLTVDDRGKQPTVFLHTSSNPTHTQKFPKGIRTLPNLKVARRYARELLDGTPIVSKSA